MSAPKVKLSRRDFLKVSSMVAAGSALAACAPAAAPAPAQQPAAAPEEEAAQPLLSPKAPAP